MFPLFNHMFHTTQQWINYLYHIDNHLCMLNMELSAAFSNLIPILLAISISHEVSSLNMYQPSITLARKSMKQIFFSGGNCFQSCLGFYIVSTSYEVNLFSF